MDAVINITPHLFTGTLAQVIHDFHQSHFTEMTDCD